LHPKEDRGAAEWPDGAAATPLEDVVAGERAERVHAALGRLAPDAREVLVLRFQEDMDLNDIAEVTGAPLSTVKSRLYRGLETLRGLLPEEAA
jgi:RNA polymerase sigma-70 factor (ECF subfamily)